MSGVCGIYVKEFINSLFLETMRGVAARVSLHHIVMIMWGFAAMSIVGVV